MLRIRHAKIDDLPAIVRMLADDFLGQQRERLDDPLPEGYIKAFREIENDLNNELIVAVLTDTSGTLALQAVVGTLQITFTPSLSYQGGKHGRIGSS